MTRKKTEYYVNNKEFLAAITDYREKVFAAKEANKPRPRVTNYLGSCFLKIATHLSYKPNFVNYMFREDMICDGIENCLQYIDNFNPEKSKNPFAYFTQIIYYAFLRRIEKEKKQLYIKYKTMNEFDSLEENSDTSSMESEDFISTGASPLTSDKRATIYDFIYAFEEKKRKKKKPKTESSITKLTPLSIYFNEELPA